MEELPFMPVEKDPDDYRFVRSFAPEEIGSTQLRAFFDTFGFVVVRNVLTEEECAASLQSVFSRIQSETPGFDASDVTTWHLWKSRTFGLPSKMPMFESQLLQNRQNPVIYKTFLTLSGKKNLLVNHDRWALYRPTAVLGDEYQTKENLHLDIHPWRFDSDDPTVREKLQKMTYNNSEDFITENNYVTARDISLQGILNFYDNEQHDGGLTIVPGFHRYFPTWLRNRAGQMMDAECRFVFADNDPLHKNASRVTCRAGSLVVWDQRCAHGARPNKSTSPRCIQFIKMIDRDTLTTERRRHRVEALRWEMKKSLFMSQINATGHAVFDL